MNTNTIVKPATLLKEDFVQNLIELCNNSGLPFFIVESIMRDILQEIHMASQRQLDADRVKYEQELKMQSVQFAPIKEEVE